MAIELRTPDVAGLSDAMRVMRAWQDDDVPFMVHPGDLGWAWRFGAEQTAAVTRTWWRGPDLLAVAVVDPDVVRLAISPDALDDEELARRVADDVTATGCVEAPVGARLRTLLADEGWVDDEPWAPFRRDLADPVVDPGVRIEVTAPDDASVAARVAAQRGAWERSTFTAEAWHTMAAGPAYADARCLVARDEEDRPVAAITVWSAGPGRPGLIEPMGAHRDHRGRGYGTAITRAGAAALRELGSSSAVVCTPASNTGGVATYVAAGFERLPDKRDLRRVD